MVSGLATGTLLVLATVALFVSEATPPDVTAVGVVVAPVVIAPRTGTALEQALAEAPRGEVAGDDDGGREQHRRQDLRDGLCVRGVGRQARRAHHGSSTAAVRRNTNWRTNTVTASGAGRSRPAAKSFRSRVSASTPGGRRRIA